MVYAGAQQAAATSSWPCPADVTQTAILPTTPPGTALSVTAGSVPTSPQQQAQWSGISTSPWLSPTIDPVGAYDYASEPVDHHSKLALDFSSVLSQQQLFPTPVVVGGSPTMLGAANVDAVFHHQQRLPGELLPSSSMGAVTTSPDLASLSLLFPSSGPSSSLGELGALGLGSGALMVGFADSVGGPSAFPTTTGMGAGSEILSDSSTTSPISLFGGDSFGAGAINVSNVSSPEQQLPTPPAIPASVAMETDASTKRQQGRKRKSPATGSSSVAVVTGDTGDKCTVDSGEIKEEKEGKGKKKGKGRGISKKAKKAGKEEVKGGEKEGEDEEEGEEKGTTTTPGASSSYLKRRARNNEAVRRHRAQHKVYVSELETENERLRAELQELKMALAARDGQISLYQSLLRDTQAQAYADALHS